MTIRAKTLLIVGVTFLVLIGVLHLVLQNILLRDFTELEEDDTRQNVGRVLSALSGELYDLSALTADWAAWDDTYAFIEDASDEYRQSNLIDGTFIELGLSLMVFVNSSGQIIFDKAFDLDDEKEVPVPQSLQEHLGTGALLLAHPDTESSISGIVLLAEGPMLVASQPILPSEEEGPIRGALIMGRFLDASEIELLSEVTHLSLDVQRFTDSQIPADFQVARSALSEEAPIFTQPLSEQSIAGYALLKDIYGKPSLVLRVDLPRDIYQQGRATIGYIMWSIVAVGLVIGLVTVLLLERQVLSRLSGIMKSVSTIGATSDFTMRVPVTGTDELANLGNTINRTLVVLQEAQQRIEELYEHEKELRHSLEEEIKRRVEFTRAVVHELKTPLTSIVVASELLADEVQGKRLLSLAESISRSASTMNIRIDTLLALARGELGMLELNYSEVDPLRLLNKVVDEMSLVASKRGLSLVLDVPSSLPLIRADEGRLEQVVLNLLTNAFKWSPQGGEVILKAGEKEAALIVEVQDKGSGIAKENQQRIFEAYYRVESDRQHLDGLGLGLALCKIIVEAHGGKIWVESKEGKGSTFGFSVPLRAAVD